MDRFTRIPEPDGPDDGPDDQFLRLACLLYSGSDGPDRWAEARRLLDERPDLPGSSIYVAAALAAADTVDRLLAVDPGLAGVEGGPHGWEPLLYLAYSRVGPAVSEAAVVATARSLLAAGADANAGFLHAGLPTPFTALTGAFGEGEAGPARQPRHTQSLTLARVLLEAGADPNDGQALYNRMFEPDDSHLELLFSYGLGTGSGGPWRERTGGALDAPEQMLRGQLRWAVTRGFPHRVRLLIDHGVDIRSPFDRGPTATELAASRGNRAIVDLLVTAGAPAPQLDPPDALVGAALAGDRGAVARVGAVPGVIEAARGAHPVAVLDATEAGRPDAVELLVELGFDVNARARPGDGYVLDATALHIAAVNGAPELCRRLLALGADPEARDAEHDSTPLGWARYGNHPDVVDLLEPVTNPEP